MWGRDREPGPRGLVVAPAAGLPDVGRCAVPGMSGGGAMKSRLRPRDYRLMSSEGILREMRLPPSVLDAVFYTLHRSRRSWMTSEELVPYVSEYRYCDTKKSTVESAIWLGVERKQIRRRYDHTVVYAGLTLEADKEVERVLREGRQWR